MIETTDDGIILTRPKIDSNIAFRRDSKGDWAIVVRGGTTTSPYWTSTVRVPVDIDEFHDFLAQFAHGLDGDTWDP